MDLLGGKALMSYVVLARKWRPMRFEDLTGQDHVARTLANAIAANRVAHAFLFTGVRGVGKTTSARILAKALNCVREPGSVPPGTDPGPTATPCLVCGPCREIAIGSDVDVREIDGASYNGVDEVRRLQDSLPYRPARDRFKIFIIDEVHMLSQSAWNAFLKTLEEPPPHVKFIFATTEVHKVPITILSRVQRFDFRMIGTQLIAARLRHVLSEEGIKSDDSALSIIAREAAGSMRDALSLLDQVIAYSPEELVGDEVARVLGVASRKALSDVAGALIAGDARRCLEVVAKLSDNGFEMTHVARDLLSLLRDLVVAKLCDRPTELLDLADEEQKEVLELARGTSSDDLLRLHQGFSEAFDDVARSGQPRAALEMLFVRLARRPPLIPLDDLIGRLAELERQLGGPGRRSGGTPERGPTGPKRELPPGPAPAPARATSREPQTKAGPRQAPAERSDDPPAAVAAKSPAPLDSEPPGPALSDRYARIVDRVREQRPELAAFFCHATPLRVDAEELRLGWEPGSVFVGQATNKESMQVLERAAAQELGGKPRLSFDLAYTAPRGSATLAEQDRALTEEKTRRAVSNAKAHPRVADALEILGARLRDLKLAE